MKVLITGATGFIGQKLINAIDDEINVLSRKQHSEYKTFICDLQSMKLPDDALCDVDIVFHLAGLAHDLNIANNELYRRINFEATKELAELAVKSNVKKFLFVSSVKAGGMPIFGQCADEDYQSEPDGIYGKTKREAELVLLDIAKKSEMHISIIRPSLVYGPKVKGNLKSMLSGIDKGWFPPIPEIGNRKSMIHVDDLVRAMLFLVKKDNINGEIFIATDNNEYSSRAIYDSMRSLLGKPAIKWSMPILMFKILALMGKKYKYKVDKLLGDECYSSIKLHNLGFRSKKTLNDMNKSSFIDKIKK